MTMNRGGFSNLIAPGYRKVLFESYKERPTEGNKVINMDTADRAYYDDQQVGGFGTLVEKAEGGPISLQDAQPGGTKRYTWTTYGLGFRITQEMYEDDLYGVMGNKMAKALGRSVRNNFELVAFSVLNNAFNSAFVGFTAGEALCQTHTTLRGPSISNAGTADFGLLSFQAALEHFHGLTDESGLPIVYLPKQVIHSIGDYWMVNQVLKTPQLPGSNANDINQAAREGVTPQLVHYLSDPDAWFVTADNHDMNYFDRRKATFRSGDDMLTGDALYIVSRRNGAGFGDWRGVYGSPGQ